MQQAFEDVYDSYCYVMGDKLDAFEKTYAQFNQTNFAVGVSNGLDALHLSLRALGIGTGDEVIVPSNTFIATVLSISFVGAIPVFVEPDIRTYNLNPELIEASISTRTRALVPVHLYGQACDMESITDVARRHDLFVVEDNAQAHLASFQGKPTGSWGDINGTSFYPGKNLGALGDGGAITTNSEQLANNVRTLRNYGSQEKYKNKTIGYNMRLDEMQAAFLSVKIRYLTDWTRQRQSIAQSYSEGLADCKGITLPYVHPQATHSCHLYVIRSKQRDALQAHLAIKGISTLIHYPIPPHLQKAYANLGYKVGDFPIAEELAKTGLSLPIWPGMSTEEIQEVIKAIRSF
jgi:dTDP-4-amino-4,6-dideoxygalactose transaminase